MVMGCSVTHDTQRIQTPDVERQTWRDEQSTLEQITGTHSRTDVPQDAQDDGLNAKGDYTDNNVTADDNDTRQSLDEGSDAHEYISNYYDSCNIKNPKKVRLLSKHKYPLESVNYFKVIDDYVFISTMEYNHWFSLDNTAEKTNTLRGYWGIANDKYIYSHIDDFWIYDYRNNRYVWKNKFKGYYDEGITPNYTMMKVLHQIIYILHMNQKMTTGIFIIWTNVNLMASSYGQKNCLNFSQ